MGCIVVSFWNTPTNITVITSYLILDTKRWNMVIDLFKAMALG